MFTTITAVDLAKEGIEAFNIGNRTRLGELFADDVTYTEVATNQVFKGREEVLNYIFDMWRKAYPDHFCRIVDVLPGENKVGMELVWSGTHQGEIVTPAGTFPPTGKSFTLPAFMVSTIKDGKIVSIVHYFDMLTSLTQLGLVPESFLVPA